MDFEEYELKYSMYLAERELSTEMINIGGSCLYETVGLISIQESLKETVTKYIGKIKDAIEKAFKRFQEIVADSVIGKFMDSIKGKIANSTAEFSIKNFYEYNLQKLQSIKPVPLDMEAMKESLQSKEQFLKDYFQELASTQGANIKEKMESLVKSQPKDIHADKDLFIKISDFMTKTIPAEVNEIKTGINTWITSSKAMEAMANSGESIQVSVNTSSTTSQVSTGEAVALFESYLIEDEEPKTEIVPDEGSEKSDKGKTFTKNMVTYTSVTIDILSAKMSIIKDMFSEYFKIITYQFGKPKTEEQPQNS